VIACLYFHSLGDNKITDSGITHLSAAVEKLVNLLWVDQTHN